MRSFRVRLTLWNVLILALSLTAFGIGLSVSNQQRMAADIDRELAMRAQRTGMMGPPPGMPPGGFMQNPGFRNPPRDESDSDPLAYLRRPEFFDRNGNRMGGPSPDPVFDPPALPVALSGHPGFSDVVLDGTRVRVFTSPRFENGEFAGAIQVARDLRDYDLLWTSQMRTLFLLLPLALIAAGVGALFLTNRALKPVADVTHAAAEIGEQDLSRRLKVEGDDELAELAKTFNAMIGRLDASFTNLRNAFAELEQLYENQRRFTADASHELRTPLTRLRLATSSALETGADPKAALKVADQAAEAMSKLVQQLLVLSQSDAGGLKLQNRPLDLRLVASDAVDECQSERIVQVDLADAPVMACGDPDYLKRVFINLVENAVRHTPPDGTIVVSVKQEGGLAVATVSDTGEGIAPEHVPHVFERFYRADAARSRADGGSGLGLAIGKSIVEAHDGSIEIQSTSKVGTIVTLRLPLLKS